MRFRSLATLAVSASIVAGTTGVALAQWTRPDRASDRNIWNIQATIDREIAQLNHDDRDYGGHRVNALRDLRAAHDELIAAERYARSHGY
jgi:hypothetical protein